MADDLDLAELRRRLDTPPSHRKLPLTEGDTRELLDRLELALLDSRRLEKLAVLRGCADWGGIVERRVGPEKNACRITYMEGECEIIPSEFVRGLREAIDKIPDAAMQPPPAEDDT